MKSTSIQCENNVTITGTLMDVVYREGKSKKDNSMFRSGTATIRVHQHYGDKEEVSDIPVEFIASKFTKDGRNNQNYIAYGKFADTYKTAQNVGIENATRLRISGAKNGRISENMYASTRNPDTVISGWRLSATFFNEPNKAYTDSSNADTASFAVEMVVMNIERELNNGGEETGRIHIKGGIFQYGGKLDIADFYVEIPSAKEFIETNWRVGDTVHAVGRIRYTSESVVYHSENTWGEDIPQESTRKKRELIITGSKAPNGGLPYEDDMAYDTDEVNKAFADYKARKEQVKVDARSSGTKVNELPKSATAVSYSWDS